MSTAGGIARAPERARVIGATAMQIFTKTPNQWREPAITDDDAAAFRAALAATRVTVTVAHDSYLINLASPDTALRRRSMACFTGELERCRTLGIPFVVTHPGNFMDDRKAGLARNAEAYGRCLEEVDGPTILIETTAGAGTALGATFDELAALRDAIPPAQRARVAFCADTCHLYAAGYDLVGDWDGVWNRWDQVLGLHALRCLHLNDSVGGLGSHRDRHAWIGEGALGPDPFRRIMRDPRFTHAAMIVETPKGDDAVRHDRRMLRRLRAYATGGRSS